MDSGVVDEAKEEQGNADGIDHGLVGLGGEGARVVDGQGTEQTGQGPVEGAVPEDVHDGHRVGGELVHKQGLDLALGEVKHEHAEAEPLCLGHVVEGGIFTVKKGSGSEDEDVQKDGTKVFDHEDGSPSDLRAYNMRSEDKFSGRHQNSI